MWFVPADVERHLIPSSASDGGKSNNLIFLSFPVSRRLKPRWYFSDHAMCITCAFDSSRSYAI